MVYLLPYFTILFFPSNQINEMKGEAVDGGSQWKKVHDKNNCGGGSYNTRSCVKMLRVRMFYKTKKFYVCFNLHVNCKP